MMALCYRVSDITPFLSLLLKHTLPYWTDIRVYYNAIILGAVVF